MYVNVRLGKKGEVVIPAFIRENMKLEPGEEMAVTYEQNEIKFIAKKRDVVAEMREHARKVNLDPKKLVYGDELYEEIFGEGLR